LSVGGRYCVVEPKLRPAVYEVTGCVSNRAFTWRRKVQQRVKRARLSEEGKVPSDAAIFAWAVSLQYSSDCSRWQARTTVTGENSYNSS